MTKAVGLAAVREGVQDYLVKGQTDGRQIARAIRYAIERKHAREQLRQQRELLRVTLASIGDAVLATDTAGRITFLNPVAAGLTGWTEEQALGQPVEDVFQIINEKTRQSAEDIVGRVLREGRVVSLANHTALVARDGREIPIEDSAAPIRDGAGEVAGAVLVFHDVTGKRRAQEALRESESRLHSLSDNLPEGAIYRYCQSIDGKPHFEFLSAGIERLTGIPAAELMGDAETVGNVDRAGRPRSAARRDRIIAREVDAVRSDGAPQTPHHGGSSLVAVAFHANPRCGWLYDVGWHRTRHHRAPTGGGSASRKPGETGGADPSSGTHRRRTGEAQSGSGAREPDEDRVSGAQQPRTADAAERDRRLLRPARRAVRRTPACPHTRGLWPTSRKAPAICSRWSTISWTSPESRPAASI